MDTLSPEERTATCSTSTAFSFKERKLQKHCILKSQFLLLGNKIWIHQSCFELIDTRKILDDLNKMNSNGWRWQSFCLQYIFICKSKLSLDFQISFCIWISCLSELCMLFVHFIYTHFLTSQTSFFFFKSVLSLDLRHYSFIFK